MPKVQGSKIWPICLFFAILARWHMEQTTEFYLPEVADFPAVGLFLKPRFTLVKKLSPEPSHSKICTLGVYASHISQNMGYYARLSLPSHARQKEVTVKSLHQFIV